VLANNKARPQTAAVKQEKTVDIRKQQELEEKIARERKIKEADMELQNAKMALMAFDSKPTKTKKQQKEELNEFPTLDDEEKKDDEGLDSLMDEPKKSGG
jgi:hypothetical protein